MRIFEFAKWWWDKNDALSRTIMCTGLFWIVPCAISSIWIGKSAVAAGLFGIITVVVGWGLYGVFCILRDMWNRFNDENPSEEIAIMRKLKGIPTPSRKEEVYYD